MPWRFVFPLLLLCAWGLGPVAASSADRPVERVVLADGRRYEGLIESENDDWIYLIQILRPAGRPMHLVVRPIDRASVASVARLTAPQRAALHREIEQFINRSQIEAGRMEAIHLAAVREGGRTYQRYHGKWFALRSTADEPTTRRVAVQMEQIFAAYRQTLAPRVEAKRSLEIVIFGSIDDYQAELARLGLRIESRACFIEDTNRVYAGSELARFAAELAKVGAAHDEIRKELEDLESRLQERLKEIAALLKQQSAHRAEVVSRLRRQKREVEQEVKKKRDELAAADRRNAQMFDQVTRQMFTRLYHEAFHAYLENYVYPHDAHDVPVWLNEGLAMVCEEGLLESGVLRIDAPSPPALKRLKADLAGPQPLELARLLASSRQTFLVTPDASAAASDRNYLYSWGLAYYLTFEKRLLDSPGRDEYVRPAAKTTPPVARFEKLVGMPLPEFEKEWREYILKLR